MNKAILKLVILSGISLLSVSIANPVTMRFGAAYFPSLNFDGPSFVLDTVAYTHFRSKFENKINYGIGVGIIFGTEVISEIERSALQAFPLILNIVFPLEKEYKDKFLEVSFDYGISTLRFGTINDTIGSVFYDFAGKVNIYQVTLCYGSLKKRKSYFDLGCRFFRSAELESYGNMGLPCFFLRIGTLLW